jgi:3-oxoacyl-[acyl-carrier-protein] synthase-3
MFRTVITGTGSYIPPHVQTNQDFAKHIFYTDNHEPLNTSPLEIIEKFKQITGIAERRYTTDELSTSDIGIIAAKRALSDSGADRS